jgi:phosphoglycerate dehydrogenase-like enzyme
MAEKQRVMVLDRRASDYAALLHTQFPDIDFVACTSYSEVPSIIGDNSCSIALTYKIPGGPFPRAALIEGGLKWVHVGGAGIDHMQPWPDSMTVTNSSGIHGDIIAEYVVAAIIGFNHNARRYELQQAGREWHKYESRLAAGQTLAVIGYGSVGSHVGRLARSIGMNVVGVRSRPERSGDGIKVVGLDRLADALGKADHVALCLPLTTATRGMLDADALAAMKPGAHLVNVSRGGVLDEDALLAALASGHVAGATMDVFASEPLPADSPFWTLDTVRVTPHSSSDVVGWEHRVLDIFKANLELWLAGRPLRNVVQQARGY